MIRKLSFYLCKIFARKAKNEIEELNPPHFKKPPSVFPGIRWWFFILYMAQPKCQACLYEKYKVQANPFPEHTCAQSKKGYKAPEIKDFGSRDNKEPYVKVFIRSIKQFTGKATLFLLKKQFINDYEVKAGNEVWFPNHEFFSGNDNLSQDKYIWVKKSFYDNMAFV